MCSLLKLEIVHCRVPTQLWKCYAGSIYISGRLLVKQAGAEEACALYSLVVTPLVNACLMA